MSRSFRLIVVGKGHSRAAGFAGCTGLVLIVVLRLLLMLMLLPLLPWLLPQEHWPGSELRMVNGGHVSAFLMHQDAFRAALRDSLARLEAGTPAAGG